MLEQGLCALHPPCTCFPLKGSTGGKEMGCSLVIRAEGRTVREMASVWAVEFGCPKDKRRPFELPRMEWERLCLRTIKRYALYRIDRKLFVYLATLLIKVGCIKLLHLVNYFHCTIFDLEQRTWIELYEWEFLNFRATRTILVFLKTYLFMSICSTNSH